MVHTQNKNLLLTKINKNPKPKKLSELSIIYDYIGAQDIYFELDLWLSRKSKFLSKHERRIVYQWNVKEVGNYAKERHIQKTSPNTLPLKIQVAEAETE